MAYAIDDENLLLIRARSGDADAFGILYARYLEPIRCYIAGRIRNTFDTDDLTSQVFLKAWEALPSFEQRDGRFLHWLYRIAHNTVIDHYRAQRRTIPASLLNDIPWEADGPTALDQLITDEESATLAKAVKQLPHEQRRVVLLRFVEGLSHTEIAHLLDKSIGTCRVIQHRALIALNRMLSSTLSVVFAIILLLGGTIFAAEHAVPGSPFYPTKKIIEQTQLLFAPDARTSTRLHLDFADKRLAEITILAAEEPGPGLTQAIRAYQAQLATLLASFAHGDLTPQARSELLDQAAGKLDLHIAQLRVLADEAPEASHRALAELLASVQAFRERIDAEIEGSRLDQSTAPPSIAPLDPSPEFPTVEAYPSTTPLPVEILPSTTPLATATFQPTATASAPPTATPTMPASITLAPATEPPAPTASATRTLVPATEPSATPTASPSPYPTAQHTQTGVSPSATLSPSPSVTPFTRPPAPPGDGGEPAATPTNTAPSPHPTAQPTPTRATPSPTISPSPSATPPDGGKDPAATPTYATPAPATPTYTMTAEASTPTPTSTPQRGNPDEVQITIDASQTVVTSGDRVVFTLRMRNESGGAVVADILNHLPETFDYLEGSATAGGSYTPELHAVHWQGLVIPAGQEVTLTVEATARPVELPEVGVNLALIVVAPQDPEWSEIQVETVLTIQLTVLP